LFGTDHLKPGEKTHVGMCNIKLGPIDGRVNVSLPFEEGWSFEILMSNDVSLSDVQELRKICRFDSN